MTEREAWLAIADAWDHAIECYCEIANRSRAEARIEGHLSEGVCACIAILQASGKITLPLTMVMARKVETQDGSYRWSPTMESAPLRAAFCREQAEKCK